eukprot:TRINITY_DN5729_c0_g1_i5.p1 TRINITY_DN5729_c0_g1~~TRINITY_DN5729_c0_g1_i5.p1  ORF type:complete len:716 (-),score=78.99 TRINITY_DN5729_c0_g1_i5:672-2819(-)
MTIRLVLDAWPGGRHLASAREGCVSPPSPRPRTRSCQRDCHSPALPSCRQKVHINTMSGEDDDFSSCPVCFELFDDPRLFPCGHSFCFKCVQQLSSRPQGGQLMCPICNRTLPATDVASLPKNYSLIEMIARATMSASPSSPSMTTPSTGITLTCIHHSDQKLEFICTQCNNARVCAKCLLLGPHKMHPHADAPAETAAATHQAEADRQREHARKQVEAQTILWNDLSTQIRRDTDRMNSVLEIFRTTTSSHTQSVLLHVSSAVSSLQSSLSSSDMDPEAVLRTCASQQDMIARERETWRARVAEAFAALTTAMATSSSVGQGGARPNQASASSPPPQVTRTTSSNSTHAAQPAAPSPSIHKPIATSPPTRSTPAAAAAQPQSSVPTASPPSHSSPSSSSSSSSSSPLSSGSSSSVARECIIVMGGYDGASALDTSCLFDARAGVWVTGPKMLANRNNLAAIQFQNSIIALGGEANPASPSVEMISCEVGRGAVPSWRTSPRALPDLLGYRGGHACVNLDSTVFMLGGNDRSSNPLTSVSSCLAGSSWNARPPMRCARTFLTASVIDGRIFAVGGYSGANRLATVESFSPASASGWQDAPPLSQGRAGHGSVTVDGSVYVMGGFTGSVRLHTMEVFDATSGRWVAGPALHDPRTWPGAAYANGAIYVMGGFDGKRRLASVERLDPREGIWTLVAPLPYRVSGMAAVSTPLRWDTA